MDIHALLDAADLKLPAVAVPAGVYVSAVRAGHLIFVAGQIPVCEGKLQAVGPVPSSTSLEDASLAARQCLLNALAAVDAELAGDWGRFVRVVRLGVFVSSDDTFTGQAGVANAASELLGQLFGSAGEHARVAVGINTLPLGASVEVELLVEAK